MFGNKLYEEKLKQLETSLENQQKLINQVIETYAKVVMHIKDQAQRIEDIENTVQGIIQLTMTHPEQKKSKKKKVTQLMKTKRDTYVEVGTMEEAKILDNKLNGGKNGERD